MQAGSPVLPQIHHVGNCYVTNFFMFSHYKIDTTFTYLCDFMHPLAPITGNSGSDQITHVMQSATIALSGLPQSCDAASPELGYTVTLLSNVSPGNSAYSHDTFVLLPTVILINTVSCGPLLTKRHYVTANPQTFSTWLTVQK